MSGFEIFGAIAATIALAELTVKVINKQTLDCDDLDQELNTMLKTAKGELESFQENIKSVQRILKNNSIHDDRGLSGVIVRGHDTIDAIKGKLEENYQKCRRKRRGGVNVRKYVERLNGDTQLHDLRGRLRGLLHDMQFKYILCASQHHDDQLAALNFSYAGEYGDRPRLRHRSSAASLKSIRAKTPAIRDHAAEHSENQSTTLVGTVARGLGTGLGWGFNAAWSLGAFTLASLRSHQGNSQPARAPRRNPAPHSPARRRQPAASFNPAKQPRVARPQAWSPSNRTRPEAPSQRRYGRGYNPDAKRGGYQPADDREDEDDEEDEEDEEDEHLEPRPRYHNQDTDYRIPKYVEDNQLADYRIPEYDEDDEGNQPFDYWNLDYDELDELDGHPR
ncbi:MAG: hypothetical protein Q9198_007778 [Flavoplaca austrocitrina]